MSEIKVNSIKGVGASAAAITVNNTDGTCTANITNNLSNRNIVKNGAMMVDQRNSGSTATSSPSGSSVYGCDRMLFSNLNTGELTLTLQQVTDAPAGFYYSQKVTVATPESSGGTPAADDRTGMQYRFEGYDINHLNLGTANAKDFVVSFYIKVSVAGNYGLAIVNNSGSRSYCVLFAATTSWTRVSIKVPKDTSGTYAATNAEGLALKFGFYNGSSRVGSDQGITGTGSWQSSNTPQGTTGQTQFGGTNGATWQITGIQLEVGSVATDFEHRSFAQELSLCQRYFCKLTTRTDDNNILGQGMYYSDTQIRLPVRSFVEMRSTPTVETTNSTDHFKAYAKNIGQNFNTFDSSHQHHKGGVVLGATITDNDFEGAAAYVIALYNASTGVGVVSLNAEL
jgi:hypothetical protein